MNRKDRRRQQKLAGRGSAPPPRHTIVAPAGPGMLSATLMRHAGLDAAAPVDRAALDIIATQAGSAPIDAAFATLRRDELLRQQLGTIERALAASPQSVELLLSLATIFRHMDRPAEALDAYRRVLEIDPAREDVPHMIAALSGVSPVEAPARAADAYVAAEFDGFAARYDEVLVGWLDYRGPEILHRAVLHVLGSNPPPQDVIDLGCGTGLAARLFRPLARRLDGVDLSARMIDKARARGLYDSLHVEEIGRYLARMPGAFSLAVAADVLIYFGDLAPAFSAVAAALRPDGLFAFTLESGHGVPYRLTRSGRYCHDDAYVRAMAAAARFGIVHASDETVRREKLEPVQSRCYVLRKSH